MSVLSEPARHPSSEPVCGTVKERSALIERVVCSAAFSKSARLRDFLRYVGHRAARMDATEVHEQEIGEKVFGRSHDYDRSQDNIVRVNATDLRRRIDTYFATEGVDDPFIFSIPRGGYMPVFHARRAEAPPVPALPPRDVPQHDSFVKPVPQRRNYRAHLVWGAVCVSLAIAWFFQMQQDRAMHKLLYAWESKPAVAALWKDFVKPSQQTDIVLPDASLSIREELTGQPISLPDYINHQYMNETASLPVSKDRREDLSDIYSHNLVAFGDYRAAQQILALSPVGSSLHLTLSRFFQAESVKHDNLILIGGKKANPWIYMFDDQVNFSLDFDDTRGFGYIVNRHPHPGEAASYTPSLYPSGLAGYSVVAYLPNPSHNGNVIILTGTDSDATSAAAEFLTSEEQLGKFRKTLNAEHFPYFEVLLKTSRLSGTSLSSEILAYRTYPGLK